MASTLSRTGGARIGYFNASWPLATLSATSDRIGLSCVSREFSFPKSSIRRLSRHRGRFSSGLRIEHTVSSCPELVVFWTFGYKTLKDGLENLGYEVGEAPAGAAVGGDAWVVWPLSFVPLFGILFGIVAMARGLSSHTRRGTALAALGAAGIAFNILLLARVF
jgi:hypothetical protein